MDKYLITSFKNEIANAILNMQDKLNPNKDAYIDKDELPKILDFFGVDDVSKLLKTETEQSIFDNKPAKEETQSNQDTVEISRQENQDDAISTYGTAAYELDTRVKADLSIGTSGNPYTQQLAALQKEKALKEQNGENASDIAYKIEALNDLVRDYLKEHPKAEKEHLIVKEISYGPDGKNKALMSQTFGIRGSNAFKPNNNQNSEEKTNSETGEGETSTGSIESDDKNTASAVVTYNIDFMTLNDKTKGNWHIKGTVNAGSDNSDIQGAFQYTRVFKNDSSINFTGNLRTASRS